MHPTLTQSSSTLSRGLAFCLVGSLVFLSTGCGGGEGKKKQTSAGSDTISELMEDAQEEGNMIPILYTLMPKEDALPPGLQTVAVEPAALQKTGDTSADWASITGDQLKNTLQEYSEKYNRGITFVETSSRARAKGESDAAAIGLTTGGDAQGGMAQAIQARVTTKVDIVISEARSVKRGGGGMSMVTRRFGMGGGGSSEQEEIVRDITVSCRFALEDVAGTTVLVSHAAKKTNTQMSDVNFLGMGGGVTELGSQDKQISDLIQQAVIEFAGKIVGSQIRFDVPVYASKLDESKAGVRKLRAEDFDGAISDFKAALAIDPNSSLDAYLLGVAYEANGNYDDALASYRKALGLAADPYYRDSKERVEQYMKLGPKTTD